MDALIYAWVTILALLTTIITIRYRSPQAIFMMQLFILGLAIILEITEAQMRYRSILTPYLVILAAVGMERGYFLARQKLLQVRQI